MANPIIACTDGSQIALDSLAAGLALLDIKNQPVIVVTVADAPDPMQVTGTGFAGGTMTDEEFHREAEKDLVQATEIASAGATLVGRLGASDISTKVLKGPAGPTICDFAVEADASAIVTGSRGRGGFVRAVLGSVSDHVVRNAPCPVVISHSSSE